MSDLSNKISGLDKGSLLIISLVCLAIVLISIIGLVVVYIISPVFATSIIKLIAYLMFFGVFLLIILVVFYLTVTRYLEKREFEKEKKAKGLIKHNGEWITPKEMEKRAMQIREPPQVREEPAQTVAQVSYKGKLMSSGERARRMRADGFSESEVRLSAGEKKAFDGGTFMMLLISGSLLWIAMPIITVKKFMNHDIQFRMYLIATILSFISAMMLGGILVLF